LDSIQALILGIVQGLAEFLPVSSSGHLVIIQHLFGLDNPELVFDIAVHVGTLIAVVIFFRKDLRAMIGAGAEMAGRLARGQTKGTDVWADPDVKMGLLIILGSIPTAIIGLGFHRMADRLFSSVQMVGIMLLITGAIVWATRWIKRNDQGIGRFSILTAMIIGTAQGVAIIPGISRSGSTIAVGMLLGLKRDLAARYAFLLSLPAIVGAAILAVKDVTRGVAFSAPTILVGMLSAAVVGYLSLKLLVFIVKKGQLYIFAPYCWIVGGVALLFGN